MSDEREIHSIVFETSPYGTVDAIVEHDSRAVYFYLNENPTSRQRSGRFGMRACWVRNLDVGPHVINTDELKEGIATMLPRHDCIDPHLHRLPTDQTLTVVWLEEGTGAALLETDPDGNQQVVAMIPPWSGVDGFHGYASNCANPTDVCWPLPDNPLLTKRIDNAKQFWDSWRSENEASETNTPWDTQLPQIIESHNNRFTAKSDESPIEIEVPGKHMPMLKLLQYAAPQHDVLVTAGMSIFPQPAVELFVENPAQFRRVEIALLVPREGDASRDPLPSEITDQLAGLAMYPWQNFSWLGAGHSCNFSLGGESVGLLLDNRIGAKLLGLPEQTLPDYRDDPVNLLWLTTINKEQHDGLTSGDLTVEQIVATKGAEPQG